MATRIVSTEAIHSTTTNTSRSNSIPFSKATPLMQTQPPNGSRKISISTTCQNTTMANSNNNNSKATHVCQECGRAFSRAEHLERHLTTHMPAAASKTFICSACLKGFTRKDVLTRHVRAVHETPKTEVKKSRRRSCRRCANFKIKCCGGSGKGQPQVIACKACVKRGVECIFDTDNTMVHDPKAPKIENNDSENSEMDYSSEEKADFLLLEQRPIKRRKTIAEPISASLDQYQTRSDDVPSHLMTAAILISNEPQMDSDAFACFNGKTNQMGVTYKDSASETVQLPQRRKPVHQKSHSFSGISPIEQPRVKAEQYVPFPANIDAQLHNNSNAPLDPNLLQLITPDDLSSAHLFNSSLHATNNLNNNNNPNFDHTLRSVPEEDFHAANTLQGIMPFPSNSTRPSGHDLGPFDTLDSQVLNDLSFPSNQVPVDDRYNFQFDPSAENWFFDPGVFEFDWLRGDIVDLTVPIKDFQDSHFNSSASNSKLNTNHNASSTPIPAVVPNPLSDLQITSKKLESHIQSVAPVVEVEDAEKTDEDTLHLPQVSPPKGAAARQDHWPWNWQVSSEKQQKINLPPLRQVLEEYTTPQSNSSRSTDSIPAFPIDFSSPSSFTTSSITNPNVTDKVRQDLISLLTVPHKKQPYNPIDISLDKFPSNELFNDFIRLYFENFHGVLPMIHVATFKPEKCPSVLLSAIATIGARYHPTESAKDFADCLSELSHRSMTWMGEYNNNYQRSHFYLMAFCLQNVYALGAGNRHLFELADASRSFLINNARRAGLFDSSSSLGTSSPNSGHGSLGDDPYLLKNDFNNSERLEARWLAWRDEEAEKRLAWCIFEYDCAISTLSNRRGNIAFNDMSMRIPCEEVLWEAPNAQAWAALYPRYKSSPPKGLPFYPVLRDVISGKAKPTILPNWGKRLCSQVIARIIWDFKELEDSALNRCLALPSLTPGLRPAKDALLKALMVLVNSMTSMTEREGMSEMIHMSYLYAARDIMDLAISLARRSTAAEERKDRISRMKSIFNADPVNARALAWHAVQILAVGRNYRIHTSCDTLRVFMGGVYLWAFVKYFPDNKPRNSGGDDDENDDDDDSGDDDDDDDDDNLNETDGVKLDDLPWTTTKSMGAGSEAANWIKCGGKASIHGVKDLCSEKGAGEVLKLVMALLQRMKLWGIGEKFCMAIQEITMVD